jgi:hypothetical protein
LWPGANAQQASLDQVNVTTTADANAAISIVTYALQAVAGDRGELGRDHDESSPDSVIGFNQGGGGGPDADAFVQQVEASRLWAGHLMPGPHRVG